MKKFVESTIRSLPLILTLIVIAIYNNTAGYNRGLSEKIESSKNDLIKAPSHINLEERNDLEKVYSDEENDIAYYLYTGERDLVTIGETLNTCDPEIQAIVTSIDVYGIYFQVTSPLRPGMSGTILTNAKGESVGMISSYLDSGECYAIWL